MNMRRKPGNVAVRNNSTNLHQKVGGYQGKPPQQTRKKPKVSKRRGKAAAQRAKAKEPFPVGALFVAAGLFIAGIFVLVMAVRTFR